MTNNNDYCTNNADGTQNKNNELKEILEILFIIPMWLFFQTSNNALRKFKEITTIDITLDEYSANSSIFQRRCIDGTGVRIVLKNSNLEEQCLSYIANENAPIYIVKGYRDYLTAILLNNSNKSFTAPFNVLMVPTANYREFNKHEINLLTNKDVYFLHEKEVFTSLAEQIGDVADDVAVVNLAVFLEVYNDGSTCGEINLFEAINQWKEKDSYSFVNLLLHFCNTGLKFKEGGTE